MIGLRRDGIPKSDIALNRDLSVLQARLDGHADSTIDRFFPNDLRLHGGRQKDQPIWINWKRTQFAEDSLQIVCFGGTEAKQIEIPRGAVAGILPHTEKHRPLQKKPIRVGRPADAIEEPLDAVARQNQIEWFPSLLAQHEKALTDRSSKILFLRGAHVRLSR